MDDNLKKASSIKGDIIELRHELHRHPELAFNEFKTHEFIADYLDNLGLVPVTRNKTGIIADIGEGEGRIALRADMDALPIKENTGLPFSSENEGVMHACGHDAHMAMLLSAARLIVEENVEQSVRLIFQPSEERSPGGARGMISEGVLDGVKEIYGLHVEPSYDTGCLKLRPGPMMAAPDEFDIVFKAKGGHAAEPHNTADPIYVASLFINNVQSIISRRVKPTEHALISICSIHGGTSYNVIPPRVQLKGTVRTFGGNYWKLIPVWMGNLLDSIHDSFNIEYEFNYRRGYPALINNEKCTKKISSAAHGIFKDVKIMEKPVMGGEDFAYYLQGVPGAFAFLGVGNEEKNIEAGLHTDVFDIDEDALILGTALHFSLVKGSYGKANM